MENFVKSHEIKFFPKGFGLKLLKTTVHQHPLEIQANSQSACFKFIKSAGVSLPIRPVHCTAHSALHGLASSSSNRLCTSASALYCPIGFTWLAFTSSNQLWSLEFNCFLIHFTPQSGLGFGSFDGWLFYQLLQIPNSSLDYQVSYVLFSFAEENEV